MTERPDILNNQAIHLASDGNFMEAIACFKRAITLDRTNALLWYNLGVTYRDSGDMRSARDALFKSYQLEPENSDTAEALVTILIALNDIPEAVEVSFSNLAMNGENPHAWNLAGVTLFNSENFEEAADAFEHAVTANPYYLDALYNLKDTYAELHNRTGERECMRRIAALEK